MNYVYRDKSWLKEKYVDLEWSQTEIANFCGCSQATISRWMINHGIESRNETDCHTGNKNGSWVDSRIKDRHFLYNEYVVKKKSFRTIAKENQVSLRTVARWMDAYGIPKRNLSESCKLKPSKAKKTYRCQYCNCKVSHNKDKCLNCYHSNRSVTTEGKISEQIRSYIKQNYNHLIFDRDNYTCQECGDDSGGNLCVHHIVPFSVIRDQIIMENVELLVSDDLSELYNVAIKDKRINDVDNGITLCKACHESEHKRIRKHQDNSIYLYYATILSVQDGDTISAKIDLGFNLSMETDIRLFGVDTEELSSADIHRRGKAILAKKAISELCHPGRKIIVRTYKTGKFGRWLGVLFLDNSVVNSFLIESGLSRKYFI